jgi:ferric-dicitrate binding protein FerR (iron transport regulator)
MSANRISLLPEVSYLAPGPPAPQRQPLGALRTAGAVYLNESKVPGEVTLFLGDTVRTGAGSTAALTVPGKGTLSISQQTQLSFGGPKAYFAELKQGAVSLRAFAGAKDFDIQIGNFVVTSDPAVGADADIERAADGSARVMVTTGSVGVIGVGQPEAVFLHAGQEVAISAMGRLLAAPPTQQAPTAPPSVEQVGKKGGSHAGWIALGVAGAGGAGAAAALAAGGGGGSKPVSPFVP